MEMSYWHNFELSCSHKELRRTIHKIWYLDTHATCFFSLKIRWAPLKFLCTKKALKKVFYLGESAQRWWWCSLHGRPGSNRVLLVYTIIVHTSSRNNPRCCNGGVVWCGWWTKCTLQYVAARKPILLVPSLSMICVMGVERCWSSLRLINWNTKEKMAVCLQLISILFIVPKPTQRWKFSKASFNTDLTALWMCKWTHHLRTGGWVCLATQSCRAHRLCISLVLVLHCREPGWHLPHQIS